MIFLKLCLLTINCKASFHWYSSDISYIYLISKEILGSIFFKIKILLGKQIIDSWQGDLPTKEILLSPKESDTAIKQQGLKDITFCGINYCFWIHSFFKRTLASCGINYCHWTTGSPKICHSRLQNQLPPLKNRNT